MSEPSAEFRIRGRDDTGPAFASAEANIRQLTQVTRGFRDALALVGVGFSIRSFSSWIEDAVKTANLVGDQAQAITEGKKAFEEFQAASDKLAVSMAVKLAPAITAVTNAFREKLFPTAGETADKQIDIINNQIEDLSKQIAAHQENLKKSSLAQFFVDPNAAAIIDNIKNRIAELVAEREKLLKVPDESRILFSRADELALEENVASFANHMADVQRQTDTMLTEVIAGAANKREEILEADRKFLDNFIAEMNTAPQKLSSSLDAFISEAQRAEQVHLSNRTDKEVQTDNVAEAKRLMDEGLLSARDFANVFNQAKKNAKEFADQFVSTFESRGIQALLNGDVSGAVRGLAQDFAELVLKLTVLKPLAESIAGWLTGFGGIGGLTGNAASAGGSLAGAGNLLVTDSVRPGGGMTINNYVAAGLPPQWDQSLGTAARIAATQSFKALNDRMNGKR